MPRRKTATPVAQAVAAGVTPDAPPVIKNRIVFALDISGSMRWLTEPARQAVNRKLADIRKLTEQEGQQTEVAIVFFDDVMEVAMPLTDIRKVTDLTYYPARGGTALFDGVAYAANLIDNRDKDTSYLVLGFTDGGENSSRKYRDTIKTFVRERLNRDNWSFAFQVPRNTRDTVAQQFGVAVGAVNEWDQTEKGMKQATVADSAGLNTYFASRSAGLRKVESFYVQTDLGNLKAQDVKKALTDLSARFKVYTVDKEATVKEFVEAKTGRPYVIGSTYYALTKKEKVQPQKALLLMEKGKKQVWGGNEARDLIGLPTDGVSHASVEPGNHSNYDVFVQSTSVNRKLVRGTKVLVDVTQTTNLPATWNPTPATAGAR